MSHLYYNINSNFGSDSQPRKGDILLVLSEMIFLRNHGGIFSLWSMKSNVLLKLILLYLHAQAKFSSREIHKVVLFFFSFKKGKPHKKMPHLG